MKYEDEPLIFFYFGPNKNNDIGEGKYGSDDP